MKRSAIVGCGPRAAEHVAAYRHVHDGSVVAVCARSMAHSAAFAREHGIENAYDDACTMIESERPDVVHLVTDPLQRLSLMSLVDDLGVAVAIVEKPIAVDATDRAAIAALARGSATRFMVNMQLPAHPRIRTLLGLVEDGAIGDVRMIDASAGSTVLDQGVHLIDLALRFAGAERAASLLAQISGAEELSSSQPCPDDLVAAIELAGGVRVLLTTGAPAPRVLEDQPFYMQKRLAVHGARGYVHWTMHGWEACTEADGYRSGIHDYLAEDLLGQAAITSAALALVDDPSSRSTFSVERSLEQFELVLGAYMSALQRRSVTMPFLQQEDLLPAIRTALDASP